VSVPEFYCVLRYLLMPLKKYQTPALDDQKSGWDSIHIFDVQVGAPGKVRMARYQLTTTVILNMSTPATAKVGSLCLSGSLTRQVGIVIPRRVLFTHGGWAVLTPKSSLAHRRSKASPCNPRP
jgi:hypothetical protein